MNRVYNFNHYFLRPYSLVNGVLLPTQTDHCDDTQRTGSAVLRKRNSQMNNLSRIKTLARILTRSYYKDPNRIL